MPYSTAKIEPPLQDVMNDPIIKLLMERDGVSQEKLLPLLNETSQHLWHEALRQAV